MMVWESWGVQGKAVYNPNEDITMIKEIRWWWRGKC
jgi:hypothetical protein